jgi:hypothetical protein
MVGFFVSGMLGDLQANAHPAGRRDGGMVGVVPLEGRLISPAASQRDAH